MGASTIILTAGLALSLFVTAAALYVARSNWNDIT
jgi:hypothetical protein